MRRPRGGSVPRVTLPLPHLRTKQSTSSTVVYWPPPAQTATGPGTQCLGCLPRYRIVRVEPNAGRHLRSIGASLTGVLSVILDFVDAPITLLVSPLTRHELTARTTVRPLDLVDRDPDGWCGYARYDRVRPQAFLDQSPRL